LITRSEHRVNFFDTDTMGVVHHSNYIRWFEIGRVEFLRKAGITLNELMSDGYSFPIVNVDAKYISPARFDDELIIETTPIALTKAKMEFTYRILSKQEAKVLVTGMSKNVFTSLKTGKVVRLPEKYHLKLTAAMQCE